MAQGRPPEGLTRHTIRLFQGDKERIERLFPNVGFNRAIRIIIKRQLDYQERILNESKPNLEILDGLSADDGGEG